MSKLKEVSSNLNLVDIEKNILDYWKKNKIFEKVNEKAKDRPEWVYYDGPITANGLPHYGHAITWTMKDVLPRFWTMQDYFVSRNMGWDCQGILVEYEVEKKLNFKHKKDIEVMGIAEFNEACRQSVLKYRKSMVDYETRLGRWIDHTDEYATMDRNYIESMWWALKELYNKSLLYEGHKVVAYSTRAGMTLSAHEVAEGGYAEVVDPAVTVKFLKLDEPNTYFLAWTTTPWTLPGNLLLAVGKKLEYLKVKYNDVYYILSVEAVDRVFESKKPFEIVRKYKGAELIGSKYKPVFPYFKKKSMEGAFKVVHGDHVTTEEGTGIVHLAPYGIEDFDILLGLGISLFDYLDDEANFNNLVPDFEGLFYRDANAKILKYLEGKNLLFESEEYAHQMPICYRTKTPLIYKPIKSWYVDIQKIKGRLIEESKKVNFVPELGSERFKQWIENARDWSLSRKRYWGTPMPVWINDKTGEVKFIGSFKELEDVSGKKLSKSFDPHKPFVDEIVWKGERDGTFRRVPEVIDVWFDSGSMPFAQYHYPFENAELFKKRFPAEYISEGDDQIRLWFYTLFVLGIALFDKSPFKNVIVIGMLGDAEGKKMSKSKGNYPPVEEVFNKYGSDMFRYFLLTSPVVRGEASRFSYDLLLESKKEFFTVLWNSYRYFITYANVYNFKASKVKYSNVLDIWILARLNQTIENVKKYVASYEVMYAMREFAPFINDLSTWYIRRSRDRVSSGDKESLQTLYLTLLEVSKLLAPFLPFISEEIYTNLISLDKSVKLKLSVHLEDIPKGGDLSKEDEKIIENMQVVRRIASLGNAIRKEANIPIRQSLSTLLVSGIGTKLTPELVEILKEELNIKSAEFVEKLSTENNFIKKEEKELKISLNVEITPDLRLEGDFRSLVREIQDLRKSSGLQVGQLINLHLQDTEINKEIFKKFGDDLKARVGAANIDFGNETNIVKVD